MTGKESWKTVRMDELLTEDQIKMVTEILNQGGTDFEKTHAIRKYLEQFKDQLEAKGVLHDYLAYVIVFQIHGQPNGKH